MISALRRKSTRDRILEKVEPDTNGGCWLWSGGTDAWGYGRMCHAGGRLVHRAAYEAFNGPIGEAFVLHRCDVPSCCNPDHLFLGSHADNMADMKRKGRARWKAGAKGTGSPLSRLTDDDVRMIRASAESSYDLAKRLPVTSSLIRRIRRGRAWNHVI